MDVSKRARLYRKYPHVDVFSIGWHFVLIFSECSSECSYGIRLLAMIGKAFVHPLFCYRPWVCPNHFHFGVKLIKNESIFQGKRNIQCGDFECHFFTNQIALNLQLGMNIYMCTILVQFINVSSCNPTTFIIQNINHYVCTILNTMHSIVGGQLHFIFSLLYLI